MEPIEQIEFRAWGKISRLNRPIVVTEKLDGTNGAIGIVNMAEHRRSDKQLHEVSYAVGIYCQSRSRIITPSQDNHGFAKWVYDNGRTLASDLGPGLHFGEWWGSGINRGYGLTKGEKRFSLFNTERWGTWAGPSDPEGAPQFKTPGLFVVPTLTVIDTFRSDWINDALENLREYGSMASPGFDRPEGVVVYHKASRTMWKVTLEGDDEPKSLAMATKSLSLTQALEAEAVNQTGKSTLRRRLGRSRRSE